MRKLAIAVAVVAAGLVLGATATTPGHGALRASRTLALRGSLNIVSDPGGCQPLPILGACSAVTGSGLLPGLGSVTEAYTFFSTDSDTVICPGGYGKAFAYPITMVVAGKGAIHFALAEGATCVRYEAMRVQSQAFTVTGGTGIYDGASGSGTVERALNGQTASGLPRVTQTWIGTLVAPGVDLFDITAPTLKGAAHKTVRAPRGAKTMRVRFTVTAQDAVDGTRPVLCKPRSASRFKVGKTTVTCTAADTSGNVRTTRFTITVRATQ